MTDKSDNESRIARKLTPSADRSRILRCFEIVASGLRGPHPRARAIVFSILLVTSVFGGLIAFDSDVSPVGTAEAASATELHRWGFEDPESSSVSDSVGTNDGVRNGTTLYTGKSLNESFAGWFSGSGSTGVEINNINHGMDFTYSTSFNAKESASGQKVVMNYGDEVNIHVNGTGYIVSQVKGDSGTFYNMFSDRKYYNEDTHVVVTSDGSTVELYINGNLTDTVDISSETALNSPTGFQSQLGNQDDKSAPFNGRIDNVRVFDGPVSSSEASSLASGMGETDPSKLSKWDFEGGTGTATDVVGDADASLDGDATYGEGLVGDHSLEVSGNGYANHTKANLDLRYLREVSYEATVDLDTSKGENQNIIWNEYGEVRIRTDNGYWTIDAKTEDGTWHELRGPPATSGTTRITGVYNYTHLKLYVNGDLEATKDITDQPLYDASGAAVEGGIGYYNQTNGGSEFPAYGRIDDVVVSAEESKGSVSNENINSRVTVRVLDQDGQPVNNSTVEVWRADEDEIKSQMDVKQSELTEKANELLREARDTKPDEFDEDRKLLEDDAAYGDLNSEGVLVHSASEWELSGYETRFGVVSRDVAPDLGGPDTVHDGEERIVLSVWEIGADSLFEDDVDGAVDGAETVPEEREIVVEQVAGPDKIDDRVVTTREFIEVTDVSANGGTKTHYAASTDLPKGYYKVYIKGAPEHATYHSVGDPDAVASMIEDDLKDEANQYTQQAKGVQDHLNSNIFQRERLVTNGTGYAKPTLTGPLAIQSHKSEAPNADPGQMSLEETRDLHSTDQYLGAVYYSPTPKQVDTREKPPGTVVEVGVIRAGGLPNQELALAEEIMNELRGYLEDQIPVNTDMDLGGTGLAELESTRDTLLSMVDGNPAAEEILANTFPEHTTDGSVDLRPVSEYSSESAGYSDQIHALRTALDRAPSSTDTETDGSIEDDVLNMRLSTGGVLDGAEVGDVEVLVHWQDGTSEPIPAEYWHVESSAAGGDAVVVEDYPIPSDRATATVEILADTEDGIARGQERFENPAFDGEHLRYRSITASTLSPGPSETVTVRPRLESGSSATLANATVRSTDGTIVNSTVTTDGAVRFDTSGEGAHSIRLEYDEAGTTWVKSTRINARSAGLDTPPQVRELNDDGQYALASGLEDAEVADEAGGTETRMTAVIGAGEHAPSVVHYHPDLDDSDETIRVEVKAGEYRETVNNRVSTAVHVDLSDDALVWVDGDPIDEDGTTSAGSIQTTNGSEIVRTMTDENGETTVRVVQDPSLYQEITHDIGTFLATLTIAPIGGMALTVVEVVATVLSSTAEVATTAALPTAAAASEVIA